MRTLACVRQRPHLSAHSPPCRRGLRDRLNGAFLPSPADREQLAEK